MQRCTISSALPHGSSQLAYLDHIHACNNANLSRYARFRIAGLPVGAIRSEFATAITALDDGFMRDENGEYGFRQHIKTVAARNQTLIEATQALSQRNVIKGLHGEKFDVRNRLCDEPLCQLDRFAMPYFGFRSWGVHMNGFVRKADGIHMWIAKRAMDKPTYPGMLDNMVAGGQPTGIGFRENMIKECAEEAGIPASLAEKIKAAGTVSYLYETNEGLKPDVMINFDLELSEDFVPHCADGEVERFDLLPIAEVAEMVRTGFEFKFNCALVVIDFLIRHGYLTADNEPSYCELVTGLHRSLEP
jgi:8-oxo-dGTP pyrophosphatase MutT (NUDIX family)